MVSKKSVLILMALLFGPPAESSRAAHLGKAGSMSKRSSSSSMRGATGQPDHGYPHRYLHYEALVVGSEGLIKILSPMSRPNRLRLSKPGQADQLIEDNGYNYEAEAVMPCLRAGQLECEQMPLAETLAIRQILDQIRAQWGLGYPLE